MRSNNREKGLQVTKSRIVKAVEIRFTCCFSQVLSREPAQDV
jgi:hypothetical protein